ncbi:MAG: hypothetical protein ACRCT1_10935 [Microcoleaceae cyanobacterium]
MLRAARRLRQRPYYRHICKNEMHPLPSSFFLLPSPFFLLPSSFFLLP